MYLFVIDYDENTCSKYILNNPTTDFKTTLEMLGHKNYSYIHTEKDLLDYPTYQ